MKRYFIHDGIALEGPFTIEGLQNKGLQRHTQVWFEGLPRWVSAEKLPELNHYITGDALPPPFYEMEIPLVEEDDSFYAKRPRNLILTLIMIIISIFVLLWILNYHHSKSGKEVIHHQNSESVSGAAG